MSTKRIEGNTGPPTDEGPIYIIGGGHLGHDLAGRLAAEDRSVHLLDRSLPGDAPDGVIATKVPSLDAASLGDAGMGRAATLVAARPDDAENLLLAQIARARFGVDRVVAIVNDPRRIAAFEALGCDAIDASALLGRTIVERWYR